MQVNVSDAGSAEFGRDFRCRLLPVGVLLDLVNHVLGRRQMVLLVHLESLSIQALRCAPLDRPQIGNNVIIKALYWLAHILG